MAGILDDFPRGVEEGRLRTENKTPEAKWLPSSKILSDPALSYDPNHPGAKLLLGTLDGRMIGIDDDRHMLTVAGSRAGKGVSVIIPNLIFYPGSVLAIDPKGELASITARRRTEGLQQKVFVLDPFDRTAEWVEPFKASFNPMAALTEENPHIVEDAGLVADALVVPSGGDIHWDEAAKNFIEGLILHVATYPAYDGRRHLITVRELLIKGAVVDGSVLGDEAMRQEFAGQSIEHMEGLRAQMIQNDALGGIVQAAATEMFERPDKEMGSVLSSARRHTTFLGFPAMQRVLCGHDFDLAELKTAPGGMTVYLCLPAGRLGTCNRWLRLFVNLTLEAMEREQRKPAVPVLLCLDEFATLGRMEQIEVAAGQIAGFGCKLWPILQDLGQLQSLYKDRWQTFMGNAGVLQFFGNNDVGTLEYIAKRLGKTSLLVSRRGETGQEERDAGKTGRSSGTEVHDLMTAEEVSRFFGRDSPYKRQLIIRPGERPMALSRVVYYRDRLFADNCDPAGGS